MASESSVRWRHVKRISRKRRLGLGWLIQVRMVMVMDTNRSDLSLWCHRKYINRVYSLLSNAIYEVKWELAKNKRYIACISYEYMRDLWGMTNGSSLNNSPGIHSVAALWCHCAKINKFDAMNKFCVAFFKVKTFGKHLLLNFLNECAEVRTQLTRMRSYMHIYVCVFMYVWCKYVFHQQLCMMQESPLTEWATGSLE